MWNGSKYVYCILFSGLRSIFVYKLNMNTRKTLNAWSNLVLLFHSVLWKCFRRRHSIDHCGAYGCCWSSFSPIDSRTMCSGSSLGWIYIRFRVTQADYYMSYNMSQRNRRSFKICFHFKFLFFQTKRFGSRKNKQSCEFCADGYMGPEHCPAVFASSQNTGQLFQVETLLSRVWILKIVWVGLGAKILSRAGLINISTQ